MVGGDRVAHQDQHPGPVDVTDPPDLGGQAFEEGWVLDIGAFGLPVVGFTGDTGDTVPALAPGKDVGVLVEEALRPERGRDDLVDFLLRGPDVFEVDRFAVGALAQRFLGQVEVHGARHSVGYHQRRRGQVVGLDLRVDPPLEVAVPAKD